MNGVADDRFVDMGPLIARLASGETAPADAAREVYDTIRSLPPAPPPPVRTPSEIMASDPPPMDGPYDQMVVAFYTRKIPEEIYWEFVDEFERILIATKAEREGR